MRDEGVIEMVAAVSVNMRERAGVFVEAEVSAKSDAARVFGGWLREVREKRGIDQVTLGKKLGCVGSTVTTWEGGNGLPGAVLMARIEKWIGAAEVSRMRQMVIAAAENGGGTADPVVVVSRETPKQPRVRKQAVAERGGSGDGLDGLLDAIMACGLSGRERAMLSAAVIAMAGGIDVRVEMVARH